MVNIVILKDKTQYERIEIYSPEKVYTIERLWVDKNIGLVNACNRVNKDKQRYERNRDIFSLEKVYSGLRELVIFPNTIAFYGDRWITRLFFSNTTTKVL